MSAPNPFARPALGPNVQVVSAEERIAEVRRFDAAQCRAALERPHLQRTVIKAIHSRQRQLEKQA